MVEIFGRYGDLVIRSWRDSDVDGYLRIVGNSEAMRYISGGVTRDRDTAAAEIARFGREIATRGWSRFALSFGDNGPCSGYAGFMEKDTGIDFGGRSVPEHWGKPHTAVGCWLAMELGFGKFGFDRIFSLNHVDHYRARRMAERFGFEFVGMVDTTVGMHRRFELSRSRYIDGGIRLQNEQMIERITRRGPLDQHAEPVVEERCVA